MCEDCCMFKNQIENLKNENEIEVIKNKLEDSFKFTPTKEHI